MRSFERFYRMPWFRSVFQFAVVFVIIVLALMLAERRFPKAELKPRAHFSPVIWVGKAGSTGGVYESAEDAEAELLTDPSLFMDPGIRPGGAGERRVVSISALLPGPPKLPEVDILEYNMEPGGLLLEQRKPADLTIPTLADPKAWKPAGPRDVPEVRPVSALPFELEGPVTSLSLVFWPRDEFSSPPLSPDGVSRIAISVDSAGIISVVNVVENGSTPSNLQWLIDRVKRLRFEKPAPAATAGDSGLPMESISGTFIYYWENPELEAPRKMLD